MSKILRITTTILSLAGIVLIYLGASTDDYYVSINSVPEIDTMKMCLSGALLLLPKMLWGRSDD